jgi:hypothetical protein
MDSFDDQPRHRIRFDATINLGHIITFLGFMLAGFGAWSTLDKRVVVIEEGRKLQALIDEAQTSRFSDNMLQVKELLTSLDRKVEKLQDAK